MRKHVYVDSCLVKIITAGLLMQTVSSIDANRPKSVSRCLIISPSGVTSHNTDDLTPKERLFMPVVVPS